MKRLLNGVVACLLTAGMFVACSDGGGTNHSGPNTVVAYDLVRDWTKEDVDLGVNEWAVVGIEDLQKLSELVNSGTYNFNGATVYLMNDITINKKVLSDDLLEPEEAAPGEPNADLVNLDSIGKRDKPFCGTFDGQGYIISGFYCYQAHQGLGFFGSINAATISNFILLDSCVVNKNADATDSSDDDRFGGIVGMTEGLESTVENCVFEGVVGSAAALGRGTPYEYIGGLIGKNSATSKATNCLVVAKIYGSGDIVVGAPDQTCTQVDVQGIALDPATYSEAKERIDEMIADIQSAAQ